jgi:peptidyl-prolyl cis-trans isomerase A (cyclophilin A)
MRYRLMLLFLLPAGLLMSGCKQKKETQPTTKQGQEVSQMSQPDKKVADANQPKVQLQTSMGNIVIELNQKAAPVTVKNFLQYVEEGFYDGTIFHRVISGFMIQGGGFTSDMVQKQAHAPIINESSNGLKNDRGTIAMARTDMPNSATCQFFINHVNNDMLNNSPSTGVGYAVFGKVVQGLDVVDKIASVKTTTKSGMQDVPIETVIIRSAKVVK